MAAMLKFAVAAAGAGLFPWAGVAAETEAPPEPKATIPHSCSSDNLPYQIVELDTAFELQSWDWATGERTPYWSLAKAKHPEVSLINGCGISPKDNIAYCIVTYLYQSYIARVDKDGFAFVASTPGNSPSVVGTFGENGTFYSGGVNLWYLHDADNLTGYDKPWSALPSMQVFPKQMSETHGADTVVLEDHLVSVHRDGVVVTDLNDAGLRTYKASQAAGSETYDRTDYGGAYFYSCMLFFSANSGKGIYQVDIDLGAGTYTAKLVGKSFKTSKNDGLNCMNTDAPEAAGPNSADSKGDMKDAGRRAGAAAAVITLAAAGLWTPLL